MTKDEEIRQAKQAQATQYQVPLARHGKDEHKETQ
jgi:hypothetical protein